MRKPLVLAASLVVTLATSACVIPVGGDPVALAQLERELPTQHLNDVADDAEPVHRGVTQLRGEITRDLNDTDADWWRISYDEGDWLGLGCFSPDPTVTATIYEVLENGDLEARSTVICAGGGGATVFSDTGRYLVRVDWDVIGDQPERYSFDIEPVQL
jgi:hypothetical protein